MHHSPIQLLLVEDNPGNALLAEEALREDPNASYDITRVQTLQDALAHLSSRHCDLVLLDLNLPDSKEIDSFRAIHGPYPRVALVILTIVDKLDTAVTAVREGAQDYLYKNQIDSPLLARAVRYAVERKRLENKLEEGRRQYQAIVDNTLDVTTLTDVAGKILFESPALERVFGYKPEELVGRSIFELLHPEDLSRVMGVFKAALQVPESEKTLEFRYRHKAGHWVQTEAIGKNLLRDPLIAAVTISSRDISSRKKAEEDLQKSETSNRALLNLIPDLLLRIRVDGTILEAKDAKGHGLSVLVTECVGKNIAQVLHSVAAEKTMDHVRLALQTGNPQVFDYKIVLQQFTGYFEARLMVSGPEEVLAIVRDITERKNDEEKIEKLLWQISRDNENLRQLDQMKDDFLSTVSHELRTPLTSINGYLKLLKGGSMGPLNERQDDFVQTALRNAERLYQLVNDLLDLSRMESGILQLQPAPVPVFQVLDGACESVQNLAQQKDILLKKTPPDPSLALDLDAAKFERVLINLIGNAIKFTPTGGVIELGAREEKDGREEGVLFWVRDSGDGIPEKDLDKVFLKFYQVDNSATRKVGGTGLGLPICKRIVEAHGGRIWVESGSGKGAAFFTFIPKPRNRSREMGLSQSPEAGGKTDPALK